MNTQQTLSSQQIISAMQTMLPDLEKLVGNVLAVRAARRAPLLSGAETKLIRTIQKCLPPKSRAQMYELKALRDTDKLTPEGFAVLAQIIEKLEGFTPPA
jgi:DNA-binding transcriptional regulator YiaG